jgi:uncharacterized protein (UPF0332 family)
VTGELIDKAARAVASAKLLLAAGDTDGASNRAYYAMYDAALAALAWVGDGANEAVTRTHSGLIARFGQQFVRSGRLNPELGRSINRVQELRLTADYLTAAVPIDKAEWAIGEAEAFVTTIRELLAEPSRDETTG